MSIPRMLGTSRDARSIRPRLLTADCRRCARRVRVIFVRGARGEAFHACATCRIPQIGGARDLMRLAIGR